MPKKNKPKEIYFRLDNWDEVSLNDLHSKAVEELKKCGIDPDSKYMLKFEPDYSLCYYEGDMPYGVQVNIILDKNNAI